MNVTGAKGVVRVQQRGQLGHERLRVLLALQP